VLVPIAVLGGFPLVVGLAILAVALIGMLVHALIRSRPN
jgi:hypothetical protein